MSTIKHKRIVLALAAALGLGVAGYSALSNGQPRPAQAVPAPVEVDVAAVVEASVTEWDEYSGRLEAVERVDIRPRVSGSIESIHFQEGALVNKGDLLFVIDPRPYAAEVSRMEAALAAARSRVVLAEQELARAGRLLADNAIARREHEERENAAREARAGLQGAEAALAAARLALGYTRITAPVAGRASRAEITVGNLVAGGANAPALTTIVSVSPMYASFEVDERAYLQHTAGDVKRLPVFLGLADEDGHPRQGRLHSVDNRLDPKTGTIRLRALFDNADGRLTPGLHARVKLGGGAPKPALLVNERAVGTDQNKRFVLVVDAGNTLAWREVKLGPGHDGLRVVREGLAAGERIVVNGLQRVRPGDLVTPHAVAMDAKPEVAAQRERAQRLAGAQPAPQAAAAPGKQS